MQQDDGFYGCLHCLFSWWKPFKFESNRLVGRVGDKFVDGLGSLL